MRARFLPWLPTLLLGALILAGGCLSADEVALVLVSTEPVAGAPPPEALRVRIIEEGSGDLVLSRTVTSANGSLADLGALQAGETYVLALDAFFPAGTCAEDRAVGVSTPFEHRSGGYEVPLQLGCADEFGRTVSQPAEARLAAGLETALDGTVVLAGGVPRFELREPAQVKEVVTTVERYDPLSGSFLPSGTMVTGRAFPALQAIPQGGVAVFGGALPGSPPCEATIELIVGAASTAKGSLSYRRCFADVALLPGAERLVVGGGSDAPANRASDFEAHDLEAEVSTEGEIAGRVYRSAPTLVALGDGETALAIGGVAAVSGGPVVEAVHFGESCPVGVSACTFPVPASTLDQRGLDATAAARVACPSGRGTVYITGGISGSNDNARALDQILCIREEEDPRDMRVVPAGTLPEPRARHEMVAVRGEPARLLLVGGGRTSSITNNLLDDALLIPVDPCSCEPVTPQVLERVPLPFTGSAILHQVALLRDGSVLLTGGARIFNDDEGPIRYEALGEAALFVPEIP